MTTFLLINAKKGRHMKLNTLFLLFLLQAASISYSIPQGYESLINYRLAVQEFDRTHNQEKFDEYIILLTKYYVSGGYEDHVRSVCIIAQNYFSSLTAQKDSLIVFDVDDTALYHFHIHDDFKFIWKHMPYLANNRPLGRAPAILPVHELYDFLIDKGFKVVFLTCRPDDVYDETIIELHRGKYQNFEQLICMPHAIALDPKSNYGNWKYKMREQLAKKYTIVGCIGDRERDFEDGLTGYRVKLPNYLQRVYR